MGAMSRGAATGGAGSSSVPGSPAPAGGPGGDTGLGGDQARQVGQETGSGGGTRLAGRYRLEERLSAQDGSSIWRATDDALARQVTVRTFTSGFRRAGEIVAAARAAGRVSDHRLMHIFDADDRPEQPYIVTEWPSGSRLDELLAAGPLGPVRAAGIIAEAADALAVAHAAGLAHLCLGPESLWWTRWGDVKISGLGVAAALAGVRAADPALADTRGLAKLLYAALTGYWPGPEQTTLPAAPRSGAQACRPRQLRAGIPREIDEVTCRALFGAAGRDGPPIVGPAQFAAALAAIARASPQAPAAAAVAPTLVQPRTQLPAAPPVAAPAEPTLVRPRTQGPAPAGVAPTVVQSFTQPSFPAPAAAPTPPQPFRQTSVPASAAAPTPPQPFRQTSVPAPAAAQAPPVPRERVPAAGVRVSRGLAVILVLAVLAVVGLIVARQLTAPHGTATARALTPVSAVAFDPYGDGQGENNNLAPLAIDANPGTAWRTDWYTSARFGNLKPGTGMLLDMGRQVTITAAQITLGGTPGADVELRVGASATSLTELRPVASSAGPGGQVGLRPGTPAHGRYVLIWFTKLPPDTAGTFQVLVYNVRLTGRP
jgi:hypothetical protein